MLRPGFVAFYFAAFLVVLGGTFGDVPWQEVVGPFPGQSISPDFDGLIGGGAEYGLTQNISAKLEYNFLDFDTERL